MGLRIFLKPEMGQGGFGYNFVPSYPIYIKY